MEANGYRTVKEIHNGPFFVHDFIFVTNKLYESLRGRHIIEDDEAQVKMKHVSERPVKKPTIQTIEPDI